MSYPASKYVRFTILFTIFVFAFSMIMVGVTSFREGIMDQNYSEVLDVYNGPIVQSAPALGAISLDSRLNSEMKYSGSVLNRYFQNTNIIATSGKVKITADFVKKGLVYQPTYKTRFNADFTLKNSLEEESVISFFFPFPTGTYSTEISNAKLIVDGVEYDLAKGTDKGGSAGLKWEGKIPAVSEKVISVSYDTVGLSRFQYQGFDNPKGSQDFKFEMEIEGTRAYNVTSGLSVDGRTFLENSVVLTWNKDNLYSAPNISVSVGDKINPADQVSKVYLIMTPVYVFFTIALGYLAFRFAQGLRVLDLSFVTVLFIVFFPLFHYLSSFTVDPTSEIFSGINVSNYSMPIYLAFAIAFFSIGGMIVYLLARTLGQKFSFKLGIPVVIMALGFFPLVATIPEYFILLSLIGLIVILFIGIQVRLSK
jgi:hypothetical protein